MQQDWQKKSTSTSRNFADLAEGAIGQKIYLLTPACDE
jgi:hypothetical protein